MLPLWMRDSMPWRKLSPDHLAFSMSRPDSARCLAIGNIIPLCPEIVAEWLARLAQGDRIGEFAEKLYRL